MAVYSLRYEILPDILPRKEKGNISTVDAISPECAEDILIRVAKDVGYEIHILSCERVADETRVMVREGDEMLTLREIR